VNEVEAVFAWGRSMSDAIHLDAKMRELSAQIRKVRCGDCDLWMKSSMCPAERYIGNTGRRTGPSCEGMTCKEFVESNSSAGLRQKRREELAALTARETEVLPTDPKLVSADTEGKHGG
jgi:hypothetical protein